MCVFIYLFIYLFFVFLSLQHPARPVKTGKPFICSDILTNYVSGDRVTFKTSQTTHYRRKTFLLQARDKYRDLREPVHVRWQTN